MIRGYLDFSEGRKSDMNYKTVDEINFSIMHPRTSYHSDGSLLSQSVLNKMHWENGQSVILADENEKERYFAKRIRFLGDKEDYKTGMDEYIRIHYDRLIANPPLSTQIMWPHDIVLLSENVGRNVDLMVANNYQVFSEDVKDDLSLYALLFPCGNDSVISTIKCSLQDCLEDIRRTNGPDSCNYTNSLIRLLAYSTVYAIYEINRFGYQYYDIDMSRFFLDNNGWLVLDFSNMIYTSAEKLMVNDGRSCIEEPEEFPMTYAEPALFQTKTQMKQNNQSKILLPDYAAQNYSLSALLFRLFFDIHPYNGRLYETYDESSKMKRYNKCEAYLNNPIFIFDRENRDNCIEDDRYQTELWKNCPEVLRNTFLNIFDIDNSTRRNSKYYYPTPAEWLNLLSELGWR